MRLVQVFGRASKYSLFDPSKEMVFITMSKAEKESGKAAVDGECMHVCGHGLGEFQPGPEAKTASVAGSTNTTLHFKTASTPHAGSPTGSWGTTYHKHMHDPCALVAVAAVPLPTPTQHHARAHCNASCLCSAGQPGRQDWWQLDHAGGWVSK